MFTIKNGYRYERVRARIKNGERRSKILKRRTEPTDQEILLSQVAVTATLLRQRNRLRGKLEEALDAARP